MRQNANRRNLVQMGGRDVTADELAAMIAEEIDNNSSARAVLAKVRRGTATLADSERFTAITAEITGRLLADNVLSLPLSDRQGAFVDITAARYRDTFSVFSTVQRALDERLGINLAVIDPGFEKARAQKAGHALADQTVPESTVVRRAESAGENIVRSQHDRIVQKQAEFRDRAGLQCSAIREGGAKCCEWCASVSGKYPASDTPQGFWGRHDNCKCSILYETRKGVQRLGGSTKKWEPLEDAGAPEPARLTAEQAAEREARHPVIAFSPEQAARLQESVLTNGSQGAIIETERGMHFRSFDSASAYMKQRFGLSISGLEEMPLENLKAVSDCIHRMYRDIPKLDGFIGRVALANMTDIAKATIRWHGDDPEIMLKLSREFFTSMSIPEIEAAIQAACKENIFSTKSDLYGIFKHESVHFVEYFMTFKKYGRNAEARASLDRYELASQIAEDAFRLCKLEQTELNIQRFISKYAKESKAELIAEAYSSEDSNSIVQEIKRILKKKWGI